MDADPAPPGRGDELVDVVDADDVVVGVATRAEMRAGRLRHRCVYIVVTTTDSGVVVHRRADWKDVYPSRWDIAFGGVVGAGEDWESAATRELAEEAGIEAELVALGTGTYDDTDGSIVGRVWAAVHDGPYDCPDGEVVEVRVVPRPELAAFLASHPHCPDSAQLVLPLLEHR